MLKFVCADVSSQKFTCVRVTLVTVCCDADVKSCIRKLQDCGDLGNLDYAGVMYLLNMTELLLIIAVIIVVCNIAYNDLYFVVG